MGHFLRGGSCVDLGLDWTVVVKFYPIVHCIGSALLVTTFVNLVMGGEDGLEDMGLVFFNLTASPMT